MAFDRVAYMKEYHKQWYSTNKQKLLEKMRVYTNNHASEISAFKKEWYNKNRVRLLKKASENYPRVKDTKRIYNLKTLYGLSLAEYNNLMEKQLNSCAICKIVPKQRLFVDHNHTTNKVRGLLCSKCNFAIGLFNENASFLQSAILYLKESL